MPSPNNKADLQRFLGMVAYLAKFVPHVSEATTSLRSLIEKNSTWEFNESHQQSFNRVKELIASATLLRFYDPQLPTKITCDASQHGLGATLEQQIGDEWHPILYASRTMTSSEMNYCQLEKELLSVVFACNKFHEYIYGKAIVIENDHKPLMSITQKHLCKAPPRIQRMLLFLQKYEFVLYYVPGKQMILADSLAELHCHPLNKN